MKLAEIKAAVDAGKKVYWSNEGYTVIKDRHDQYLIVHYGTSAIGLTHQDGVTMNGSEDQFFMHESTPAQKELDEQRLLQNEIGKR